MKTDLAKTLSIRGQHGLFNYIAQSRTGAIVEAFEDKKRYNFSANAGITTLEDISIYTAEGEVKLKEVFAKMHEVLGYVSHMKKVTEWYNALKNYASLEFLTDEEREAQQNA